MTGELPGDPHVALPRLEGVDGADVVQAATGDKGTAATHGETGNQLAAFLIGIICTDWY